MRAKHQYIYTEPKKGLRAASEDRTSQNFSFAEAIVTLVHRKNRLQSNAGHLNLPQTFEI